MNETRSNYPLHMPSTVGAMSLIELIAENEYLEKQIIRNLKFLSRYTYGATSPAEANYHILTMRQGRERDWVVQVSTIEKYDPTLRAKVGATFNIQNLNTALKSLHEQSAEKLKGVGEVEDRVSAAIHECRQQ
ncbi:hypothetical protein Vi05172_g1514 [Venturia inaequalis]|nr:hypothetical protein Vi05172_g1514 [Venturia inaequalis]